NHFPDLRLRWDQSQVKITPDEVEEELSKGDPPILISGRGDVLGITVAMMEPEHVDIVARRVKEVLQNAI
ncbi:MAG: selenocysteine synthase, partial [Candidatus Paceibacterota bacterium]